MSRMLGACIDLGHDLSDDVSNDVVLCSTVH